MADRVGQQFGNYTLTRLLGKGGFAEVYLGEHVYLKSLAAIKVLLTQLGRDESASFLAEAQTLASLKHPHIVRILDFGVEDDTPFFVMEYAPNGTMRQRYPRGTALTPECIVPYVKQVASALQYAHDQKLIHRDIKPENMLLQANDEILLSDFGVALIAQSTQLQSKQAVIGTAAYMAPEQIRGKARQSSDQYALGVVVYEWLSGNHLFQGSFTEICAQHMFAPPEPLRVKKPDLSPEIEQVVMTALAKDPAQRFASVQAFATALEQACQPVHTAFLTPPPPPQVGNAASQPGFSPLPQGPASLPAIPAVQPRPTTNYGPQPVASGSPAGNPVQRRLSAIQSGLISTPLWQTIQPRLPQRLRNPLLLLTLLATVVIICAASVSSAFYYGPLATAHQQPQSASSPTSGQASTIIQQQATPTATITGQASPTLTKATQAAQSTPTATAGSVPTPTPTPAPMPTPTPTPGPSPSGPVVYSSSLGAQDGKQWDVINFAGNGYCHFDSNSYHIYMPSGHDYIIACFARQTNFSGNFTLTASMTLSKGFMIGVSFRANNNNYYRFRISPDQTWDLVDNQSVRFAQGSSSAILGLGQSNTIKIVARGTTFYIYVNGQLISSPQADTASGGMIGFFTVSSPTQTADARFTSISVKQP